MCNGYIRRRIQVSGIVQGVGFRPHIYRIATRYALTGHVKNTSAGVTIEVQGTPYAVDQFIGCVRSEAPPLARISAVVISELDCEERGDFRIIDSQRNDHPDALIAPDIATCDDCARELLDPHDRRFRYPFINCINCGPRFTILRRIPYDRPNTSMSSFRMCPECQAEYDDPLNRRFHAQPNACWRCGPQLSLVNAEGASLSGDPITRCVERIRAGAVVAIKGLGGFHLCVDAFNAAAISDLRFRKKRFEKPLAVMVPDIERAQNLCVVSQKDRELLLSPERPIVLIPRRPEALLPDELAPGNPELGIFLPYTPVQHLLFAVGCFDALVMTSANLSEEPICINNAEAIDRLKGIADCFLVHNRDILLRCDDSVARVACREPMMLRRSRGYVPVPIALACDMPPVLAVGGELKNTICITKGKHGFLGQHVGDLENLSAYQFFQESIANLSGILEVQPELVGYDLHSGYLSTQWALQQQGVTVVPVQHHHAHVASCMAENQLTGPVIGVVLDGTGLGTDGHAWGGEILIADYAGFERAAHLQYVPLPGGAQAIREPWRMAVSYLTETTCVSWHDLPFVSAATHSQIETIRRIVERRIQCPLTSGCGRLFDAVAALIGLRARVSFEAQAAMELEFCARLADDDRGYSFDLKQMEALEIGSGPLFTAIVEDLHGGVPAPIISRRFHTGLIAIFAETVGVISDRSGINTVCLTGGCFHNVILLDGLRHRLAAMGLRVFHHSAVPCGDGGLSLGQALVAANIAESFGTKNNSRQ